jgi:hypothetical protein
MAQLLDRYSIQNFEYSSTRKTAKNHRYFEYRLLDEIPNQNQACADYEWLNEIKVCWISPLSPSKSINFKEDSIHSLASLTTGP